MTHRRTGGARGMILALCALAGMAGTARAAGLPHQYLLSNQWRNLFFVHSPLTNPAFMTDENYPSVRGVFSFAPDQVAQLWEVGYLQPIGLYQTLGFTWVGENDMPISNGYFDADQNFVPVEGTLQNRNTCLMLSYGVNPWRQLSLGINLKYLNQTNFDEPITQFAADAGLSYRLLNHPVLGYHLLGVAFHNALVSEPEGGTDSLVLQGEGAQVKALYHGAYLNNVLSLDCQFSLNDVLARSTEFIDGNPTVGWEMLLQAGVWLARALDFKAFFGLSDQGPRFWGLGLGFNLPSINLGREVQALYQFRDEIADGIVTDELRVSHSIYIRMEVGRHREEVFARRMARLMNMTPNELYNRAMALYYDKKYYDAYIIYAKINGDFPDFFKDDWVLHYMGACLEKMDMRNVAFEAYQEAKNTYPASDAAPHTELGLMRLFYREADHAAVSAQYKQIVSLGENGAPDSLVSHASYLMGQTSIKQGNYSDAIQLLSRIPERHPDYLFAQHSLAVAYALSEGNMPTILTFLTNCFTVQPVTAPQREIVNRSWLLTGYLYYEQDTLTKAVKSLRNIPAQSAYYAEALLGLAWTAIKARQWADCITQGQALQNLSDADPLLRTEGMLVEAYARIYQKDYAKAATVLDGAEALLSSHNPPTEDSLTLRNLHYEDDRESYDTLGSDFVDASRRGQAGSSLAKRLDELRAPQVQKKEKVDAYARYLDRYQRVLFFGKNLPTLKSDIEYARATVAKLRSTEGSKKSLEVEQEKQQKLDEEIGKLKDELEKMKKTE